MRVLRSRYLDGHTLMSDPFGVRTLRLGPLDSTLDVGRFPTLTPTVLETLG